MYKNSIGDLTHYNFNPETLKFLGYLKQSITTGTHSNGRKGTA